MLSDINKILAKTMRQLQLATNKLVKDYLRMAVRWLNMARRHYKKGWDFREALKQAAERISWARWASKADLFELDI